MTVPNVGLKYPLLIEIKIIKTFYKLYLSYVQKIASMVYNIVVQLDSKNLYLLITKKYNIDQLDFFDIEKWPAIGSDKIREQESYIEYITSKAKEKNKKG